MNLRPPAKTALAVLLLVFLCLPAVHLLRLSNPGEPLRHSSPSSAEAGDAGADGPISPVPTAPSKTVSRPNIKALPSETHGDDRHYFVGDQKIQLHAETGWVAVKVTAGASLDGVRSRLRDTLDSPRETDGLVNEAVGVLAQPLRPGQATDDPVRKSIADLGGVKRLLRTFRNGSLPPIIDIGEVCVQFQPGIPFEEVERRLADLGANVMRPLGDYAPNGFLVEVDPAKDTFEIANALSGQPDVLFAQPNFIWPKRKAFTPNDDLYPQQWHLANTGSNGTAGGTAGEDIDAERAWEITRGSSSVIVAVFDDGVDTTHEDFSSSGKLVPGYDFLSNDSNPRPSRTSDNHGTACAGLAVADGHNGIGVSGVAPGCRLMPIRMLGGATDEAEAAAFNFAKNNGAAVISCSYAYDPSPTFIPLPGVIDAAITDAADNGRGGKGCVIVFAAGNASTDGGFSGYNVHPKVITVSATTNAGVISAYSNFGDCIDISAPGGPDAGDMVTVDRTGSSGYSTTSYTSSFNGTSAATPVVAGVAALLLSKESTLTRSQVRQRLIDSADFIGGVTYDENGHHDWYGYGRVNAWRALTWNDGTDPTISIRVPSQGLTSTVLAAADGEVGDSGTGVYQVLVAISDSQNRWWNWKSNGWSSPGSYIGTLDYHLKLASVSGPVWSVALPSLGAGSYRLHAKAVDNADNDSDFVFRDYVIDPTGPQLTIDEPQDGHNYLSSPAASGTAFDNIAAKRFALYRESDGQWFNWSTGDFAAGTFDHGIHVTSVDETSLSWSLILPPLDPAKYQLHAYAMDSSNRFSDWVRRDFRVDLPPTMTVTTPAHASATDDLLFIAGTAADPSGKGLQGDQVRFTLYQNGQFWTGTDWSDTQTVLTAPVSGGSWTYANVPGGPDERTGEYYISGHVTDNTGATSDPLPGINQTSFVIDRGPPSVAIGAPANGAAITSKFYSFTGTATDDRAVAGLSLYLRRNSDGKYWNGSSWTSEVHMAGLASTREADAWTCTSSLPACGNDPATQLVNGSYNFIAIAVDAAGNQTQTDAAVTVDFHETYTWTGGTMRDSDPHNDSSYWGSLGNWTPYGIPGPEDIAIIANGDIVRSSISRTVREFRLAAGTLDFDHAGHSLMITKAGEWTGGALADITEIAAGAGFAIHGHAIKYLGIGAVVNNSGAVTWQGSGVIQGFQNCRWNNKPGSTFTATGDGDIFSNYNSNNVFTNEAGARFVKSQGEDGFTSYIDEWTFTNAGTIDSQQGTLYFNTTLDLKPGTSFAGAGRLVLNGQTNVAAQVTSSGHPELVGTLTGTSANAGFSGTHPLVWSSGSIHGTFTLSGGSVMDLTSASVKYLGHGAVFTNRGRVNWHGPGVIQGFQACTFNNESGAVFDAVTDGDIFSNYNSNNSFHNKPGAMFLKSGRSAIPDAVTFVDEWAFHNAGTVRSDDGVIQFNTTFHLNDGGTISRGGPLPARVRSTWQVVLTGTTTVTGTTFENAGTWVGNTTEGTAGNGTIATAGSGIFEWTAGGTENTVNIAAGSTFSISGPSQKQLGHGAVVNNHGNATWTGTGNIMGHQDSKFVNHPGASFSAAADADFVNYNTGNRFVNSPGATFAKTGGTEDTRCDWAFDNNGTLSPSAATVALNGGGISSGEFSPTSGGTVMFTGGDHHLITTAEFGGEGIVRMAGGSLTAVNHVNGDSHGANLEIAGGTVTSAVNGSLSVSGSVVWTGGTIAGTFDIEAGTDFRIGNAGVKQVGHAGVINNHGAATWEGPGVIMGYQSSTWNNKAGASFTAAADGDIFANYNSGNVFHNETGATFVKTAGDAELSSYIDEWTFTNSGEITSRQGTLHLNTTLNLNPGSTFSGDGRILLHGTTQLATEVVSTGHPELVGTLHGTTGNAGFSGTNPLVWTSGAINGSFTLAAGSALELVSGNYKHLGHGCVFTNHGHVTWSAGLLQGFQSVAFHNESGGVFEALTDGDIFSNYNSGNVFHNKPGAVFLKSGRSEDPNGVTFIDEWTFNNAGTVRSDDGVVRFHTELNLNDGGTISRVGTAPARVRSTWYCLLTGTTTVIDTTFETAGDWHGNTGGTGTLATTGSGVFEWTGGTVHNTASIAAGSTFSITGSGLKQIGLDGMLNNHGTATWTGSGAIQGFQNSIFHNRPGATFTAATDADFVNYNSGNRFLNDGGFQIGGTTGIVHMHWAFQQTASGTLFIDVAGENPNTPDFDILQSFGGFELAGTLHVAKSGGYTPAEDTTFGFLSGSGITGSFSTLQAPGFSIDYATHSATLRAGNSGVGYEDWAALHTLTGADALAGADPDHDGVGNFLEYAFNTDPKAHTPRPVTHSVVTIDGTRWLTLHYRRWQDRVDAGLGYHVERSTALGGWAGTGVVDEPDPLAPAVEGSEPRRGRIPLDTERGFLRMRAE